MYNIFRLYIIPKYISTRTPGMHTVRCANTQYRPIFFETSEIKFAKDPLKPAVLFCVWCLARRKPEAKNSKNKLNF